MVCPDLSVGRAAQKLFLKRLETPFFKRLFTNASAAKHIAFVISIRSFHGPTLLRFYWHLLYLL